LLLTILSLAGLAAVISSRSIDPLVLLIARDLTVPVTTAALLATAYSLPFALAQPVLGPLGDTYGRATMMKTCLWVLAAALAACAMAPSFELLITFRLMAGIAAGGIIPSAMATIGDRYRIEHRQVAVSRFVMVSLLGQIFSAGFAGVIALALGWRSLFVIGAITATLAAISVMLVIKEPAAPAARTFSFAEAVGKYRQVFANPKALLCYGTVFLEGMALFGVLPYVAELLESRGLGTTREAGFIIGGIGAGGVLYTLMVSILLRHIGRTAMMASGGIVATAGLWGLSLALPWPFVTALFAATGFGYMMLHNSIQTEVIGLAPQARASAYSMHAFSFFSGQAIGPVLFGAGFHTIGTGLTIIIAAATLTLTGAVVSRLFLRLDRKKKPTV
jgi:predicted MFS family arabinose efflux permease